MFEEALSILRPLSYAVALGTPLLIAVILWGMWLDRRFERELETQWQAREQKRLNRFKWRQQGGHNPSPFPMARIRERWRREGLGLPPEGDIPIRADHARDARAVQGEPRVTTDVSEPDELTRAAGPSARRSGKGGS